MKHLNKVIIFWGICDLLFLPKLLIAYISYNEIPIVTPVLSTISMLDSPSSAGFSWIPLILTFLDTSLIFSAYFLIRGNRIAAIICYFQTPVRLLTAHSSISFINSFPIDDSPMIYLPLLLSIEAVKLISIILWHRGFSKTGRTLPNRS